MDSDIDILDLIDDWRGRQLLLEEAESIVNAATAADPTAPRFKAVGTVAPLPLVRPAWRLLPRPQRRGAYRPSAAPDPEIIAELVSRSTEFRSRRWSVAEQCVRLLPKDWWSLAHAAYPQLTRIPEYSAGWADLMLATTRWINERETDWKFNDAKEKMGSLRLSTHGILEAASDQVIDAAEHLGSHICQVCGAPGGQAGDFMTLCGPHRDDKGWRLTGHE